MKENPFWFVWAENGRVPSYRHISLQSATTEAERLALRNPGQRFVVLQSVGAVVSSSIQRIDLRPDQDMDIPF